MDPNIMTVVFRSIDRWKNGESDVERLIRRSAIQQTPRRCQFLLAGNFGGKESRVRSLDPLLLLVGWQ